MLSRPDAADLVALAREALLEHLLPGAGGDARYQGLMAANALAIALRALASAEDDERARLQVLLGESMPEEASLRALNARLAASIRAGELGPGKEGELRRLLRSQVEARLAVSNPRRLGSAPGPGPAGRPPW